MTSETNLGQCPEPTDTTSLHFKALSKCQVFNADGLAFDINLSLIAVSNNSGLTFIGTLNGFLILKSKYVFSAGNKVNQFQKEIVLNSKTTHISTNFEENYLAVACQTKMGPIIYIYNIPSFLTKGVVPMKTVPLSKPFQVNQLCELLWQRNTENGLITCFKDGSVSSLNLFQEQGCDIMSLPPTTQARCMCWSPKGKQIVIGCGDGSICQYKPNLTMVKKLNPPPLFNGSVTIVNVLWISNFQFLAAYKDSNKPDDFPVIVIVNAPKNEPVKFINYDDITYSSTNFRPHQFYFYHLIPWNLIFLASANSMEVAVLHVKEDNTTWEQWLLGDASRAELPLNSQKSETFPLGVTFDFTNDQGIPWGEETLPPMPRLLMLSSEGLLITFNVINTSQNAPQLCTATRKFFEDSWFGVAEKETAKAINEGRPIEITSTQGSNPEILQRFPVLPDSFASFSSPSVNPQVNTVAGSETLNFKVQPSKQQVVPLLQQQPEIQIQQPPVQSGVASIFHNPNSPSKWSQKPAFSFSLTPNSGESAINPKELPKDVEQNVNFSISVAASKSQPIEKQENLTTGKQQNMFDSNVEARKSSLKESQLSVSVGSDTKPNAKKSPESSPNRATPEIASVDDSVYVTALLDEVDHFNGDLKDFISRVSKLRVRIGGEEEKKNFRNLIENLNNLEKTLNETTTSQKSEVEAIKTDLMETFAWLEDARSRNRQRKSATFIELKKYQELDPICNRLMTNIRHLQYYIENQLKQLYSYLMKNWIEHQDNCRLDIKTMMAIPSMEELYKTLHLELKILSKQRAKVEELERKLKQKFLKNRGDSLVTTSIRNNSEGVDNSRVSELFKLADNLLQIKINELGEEEKKEMLVTDAFQMMMKKQVKAISEKRKKFTTEKENVLRDVLTEREMLKTRSVKSTLISSSFIRNTSSRIYSKALPLAKKKDTETSFVAAAEIEPKDTSTGPDFASLKLDKENTNDGSSFVQLPEKETTAVPLKSSSEKPSEFFTFSIQNQTTIQPAEEKEITSGSSEKMTTPFVFKASTGSGVSTVSVPKSLPVTGMTTTSSYFISTSSETLVTCTAGSGTEAFTFKFSDVGSNARTFSFSAKTYTTRLDSNIFGFTQATSSETPAQNGSSNKFSFSSVPVISTKASIPNSIFGNTSDLFSYAGSVSKSSSVSSIFSTSEVPSTSPVTPTTQTTTQSNANIPGKSIVTPSLSSLPSSVENVVPSLAETFGRSNSKVTTTVTTTTSSPIATTPTTTSSSNASTNAITECVESQTDSSSKSHEEVQESENSEEAKNTFIETSSAPEKTELEPLSEASVFPSPVSSTTTSSAAIFSAPSTQGVLAANSGSVFRQSVSVVSAAPNIFSTTASNIFSTPKTIAAEQSSFGSPSSPSSSSGVFGQPVTTTNSGSIFGQVNSATSAFGQSQKDDVGQTAKLFGEVLGGNVSTKNIFETPTSPVASSGGIFGKSTFEKTGGSIFGNAGTSAATTTAAETTGAPSRGIFGSSTSNIFSKGLTGQTQMSPSMTSNVFGQSQNADSGSTFFGQSICNTFGGNMTSSPNQNPFASTSGFNSKPVFGQSLFGQSPTGPNPFDRSHTTNIFGGSSSATTTTTATTTQNIFMSGSASFGSLQPGLFSRGQSTTGQTSATSAFQKPIGGNIFGSSPSFTRSGAAPTFGGAPTFGSPATFGSPQKVFGSPQGTFGQNQANAPSFGALAKQTDGFANLALQSQGQTPAFGGNTFSQNNNFGGESNFGGTSFSSWRS